MTCENIFNHYFAMSNFTGGLDNVLFLTKLGFSLSESQCSNVALRCEWRLLVGVKGPHVRRLRCVLYVMGTLRLDTLEFS